VTKRAESKKVSDQGKKRADFGLIPGKKNGSRRSQFLLCGYELGLRQRAPTSDHRLIEIRKRQ
jgi:hypothetical protein